MESSDMPNFQQIAMISQPPISSSENADLMLINTSISVVLHAALYSVDIQSGRKDWRRFSVFLRSRPSVDAKPPSVSKRMLSSFDFWNDRAPLVGSLISTTMTKSTLTKSKRKVIVDRSVYAGVYNLETKSTVVVLFRYCWRKLWWRKQQAHHWILLAWTRKWPLDGQLGSYWGFIGKGIRAPCLCVCSNSSSRIPSHVARSDLAISVGGLPPLYSTSELTLSKRHACRPRSETIISSDVLQQNK